MEEQKILFADLYRHLRTIRDGIKLIEKGAQSLLTGGTWQNMTLTLNGIVAEARTLEATSSAMEAETALFLEHGPYIGQGANRLPLEGLVEEVTGNE